MLKSDEVTFELEGDFSEDSIPENSNLEEPSLYNEKPEIQTSKTKQFYTFIKRHIKLISVISGILVILVGSLVAYSSRFKPIIYFGSESGYVRIDADGQIKNILGIENNM